NLGNPMMDGLQMDALDITPTNTIQPSDILLLPGSRNPEAERNWQQILAAVNAVQQTWRHIRFLAAISPNLSPDQFHRLVQQQGWQLSGPQIDSKPSTYTRREATLQIDSRFYEFAREADMAIAMAGTATEQVVGLGKPVMTLAGEGPQFTPAFSEAQTRLLGPSVQLVASPMDMGTAMQQLWADIPRRQAIARNGRRRLGASGAANRIAAHLLKAMPLSGP
ncbi:MAG: lipid-A-disaccharide synthase-related protein, partial [Elainellaceae cyanobacterium]